MGCFRIPKRRKLEAAKGLKARDQARQSSSIKSYPRVLSAPSRAFVLERGLENTPPAPAAPGSSFSAPISSWNAADLAEAYSPQASPAHVKWSKSYSEKRPFTGQPVPLPLPSVDNRQGLPLPLPCDTKSGTPPRAFRSPPRIHPVQSQPQPLPLPSAVPGAQIRSFTFEELASACEQFSPACLIRKNNSAQVYVGWLHDISVGGKKSTQVDIIWLNEEKTRSQDQDEWIAKLTSLVPLQHPNLCRIIGFCSRSHRAQPKIEDRLLVYEHFGHDSLDSMLSKKQEGQALDWNARMKIALGIAKGLAYLHEKTSIQMCNAEFGTSNVLIDKDNNAKLVNYGFQQANIAVSPSHGHCGKELGGELEKYNLRYFGMMLLELLTGRQHMDKFLPREERDLLEWARPLLSDEGKLQGVMDPKLKGQYPTKSVKDVANLALKCLQKECRLRPSMSETVEFLMSLQDLRHPSPVNHPKDSADEGTKAEPRRELRVSPSYPSFKRHGSHKEPTELSSARSYKLPCSSNFGFQEVTLKLHQVQISQSG